VPWQQAVLQQTYVLTAKKLSSKKVRINGKRARLKAGALPTLASFERAPLMMDAGDALPAHAVAFWLFGPKES
jgi:heparanase 1